ncbi:hypothetical protein AALP_AA7G200200 [Arabis alpina]|uniref:Uncharacterized protein n=1 Tax=Arabis alpina TaxID=50452 RepID=A0A087GJB1_ARAAL|nr:hypothetical protein AALP_AA7G200200 [Arabis alpina]
MNAGKQASWVVATAIATVEMLKDQGVARWNYPLRLLHKEAMSRIRTITVPTRPSSSSSAHFIRSEQAKTTSFDKAMRLSCFGPTTVRF